MDYGIHLEKVFNDLGREPSKGEVAKYIPELAKIPMLGKLEGHLKG